MIRRSRSGSDGRSLLVHLTEEGKAKAEAAFRKDVAVEEDDEGVTSA